MARVSSDAANKVSVALEQVRGAEQRAQQRTEERTAERAAGQRALAEAQTQLQAVRAQADAEVAAAREQAEGATAAAHAAVTDMRAEVERVRAEAAGDVAAAREQANAETAAAHQEVTELRTLLARVRIDAASEVSAARQQAAEPDPQISRQLMSIPLPPAGLRVHTGQIDAVLATVLQLDETVEAGVTNQSSGEPIDVALVRRLVSTVQDQADDLSSELQELPSRCTTRWQAQVAEKYADAVAAAYASILQRVADAAQQLSYRGDDNSVEAGELITLMIENHPWRSS
jgi:hypothetical protein